MSKTKPKMRGWLKVLLIIVPYLVTTLLFQYFGLLVIGDDFTNLEASYTSMEYFIVTCFDLVGTFLLLWIFMRFVDKEKFIQLGFHTKNRCTEFIIGLLLGILIISTGFGILMSLKEITFIKVNFELQELIYSILFFIIAATIEETVMRGYILKNLMTSMNNYLALFISSILFSLMHFANPNADFFSMFGIFLAGITLGVSYTYTKNLLFPIGLHLSWNISQTLLGFNVSGLDTYSIIEFKVSEANLLNGGAFGFEGSYLSLVAELITILGIIFYYKKIKPHPAFN